MFSGRAMFVSRLPVTIAMLLVLIAYVATVTEGHDFIPDDFAAYVMHAKNLVEGRPYGDIHYIFNPAAVSVLAPVHGYPPVYPLILAPVYKIWGANLRAMKIATALCFGVALLAFALLFEDTLPQWALCAAILLVGFNLTFWEARNYLLSEFPYVMFSSCALLAAQKIYKNLSPQAWNVPAALLLAFFFYGTYATRTIGIVLIPALMLADLCKFRRPSKFLVLVVLLTATPIVLQNLLVASPKEYMVAVHPSPAEVWRHFVYYGKVSSYVWQNGASKAAQIIFALFFTVLAALRFARRMWSRQSIVEFYLLGYLAVLLVWATEIGMRGLLPLLPLYFAYGLEEMIALTGRFSQPAKAVCYAALLVAITVSYAGAFHWNARQPHPLDVADAEAQELFAYVRQNTVPTDLLVFQKPRILALFTGRSTTMLAPDEPAALSVQFLAANHARFLIQNQSMGYPIPEYMAAGLLAPQPVFQNAAFQVYKINSQP
jgi:hypothetical protein